MMVYKPNFCKILIMQAWLRWLQIIAELSQSKTVPGGLVRMEPCLEIDHATLSVKTVF